VEGVEYGNIRAQSIEPAFHKSLGGGMMKSRFSPFSPHLTLFRPLIKSFTWLKTDSHFTLAWRQEWRKEGIDHAATHPETSHFVNFVTDRILAERTIFSTASK
jgi:hypothetical protein